MSKAKAKAKVLSSLEIIKKLTKDFGSSQVIQPESDLKIKGLPTGIIALDKTIGTIGGGVPIGRLTEIYGDFATGKSVLGLMLLATTQQRGGVAVLIDTEYAFNPTWAITQGIDNKNLIILTPDTQEEAYEQLDRVIDIVREESDDRLLTIVWDSVSSLASKYEKAKGLGSANMASNARVNSSALKQIIGKIAKQKINLVFINQIRSKIGVMFGQDWDTTGGKAIKFYSSVRMHAKRLSKPIKVGEEQVGVEGDIEVTKNRCSAPFKRVHLKLFWDSGFDKNSGLFDYMVRERLLKPALLKDDTGERKGYYTFEDDTEQLTLNTFDEFLENNTEAIMKALEE